MSFLHKSDESGECIAPSPKSLGAELAAEYARAQPFPHIVIDDFMPPSILDMCLANFPENGHAGSFTHDSSKEQKKTQYQPDFLSPEVRALFYNFNSLPFIKVIENITGIKGLIPDPYFLGAGFHSIQNGGFLDIHADFNHHKPMNLERRVNVLIYMNKNWHSDYGGELELWDPKLSHCFRTIIPEYNRCVIFNTNSSSFHGNPTPVSHPNRISRKSIALYYYTSTWKDENREHTTRFRGQVGTSRAGSGGPWLRELIRDWTPPIVRRAVTNAKSHRELKA
jgi:Rps23 Pro-64 3,4-dihydroxylase Tpa1-like proline 4-hydroxylase